MYVHVVIFLKKSPYNEPFFLYRGGCRALSGTSVASPVVAGAVTLLMRSVFWVIMHVFL